MTHHLSDHHYLTLSAQERFALLLEAMARRDETEADRLEETCPRFTYRAEDQSFRERVRRAYMIASRVSLNMQAGLAQLRMARAFQDDAGRFAGPVVRLAQLALLYGREYGRREAGMIDVIGLPDPTALEREMAADPELGDQLVSVLELAQQSVKDIAGRLLDVVLDGYAVDLLSQWEGFGRFCHQSLGVAPLTVAMSFGLWGSDPVAEILEVQQDAKADEEKAGDWAQQWRQMWERQSQQ